MISTSIVGRNVDIANITILQLTIIRYAMTNDFIDRCTNRLWEIVIVERRWIAISLHACLVDDPINLVRGDTRSECLPGNVQYLSSHTAYMTQTLLSVQFLGPIYSNRTIGGPITLFRFRNTRGMHGVIWLSNPRLRYHTTRTVEAWTQWTRKAVVLGPFWQPQSYGLRLGRSTRHTVTWRSLSVRRHRRRISFSPEEGERETIILA
mmetsp:Transcript_18097/g.41870  ORF Transcript_18097/g.41870 Transcript_18097/m.41870 type:complete len:207 (+) Transcript_18097:414-1034(+)